jgi:hypothetical protein
MSTADCYRTSFSEYQVLNFMKKVGAKMFHGALFIPGLTSAASPVVTVTPR